MPSWNIHIAHVERILADGRASDWGIDDPNAFLFGNLVPDIYLGFMVPDASFRIDYCLTHLAVPNVIPAPDADRFWDDCIFRRRPASPSGMSLTLGAWAHLFTDRFYNLRFREFCASNDVPSGDSLRRGKQADFDLFGRSLGISSRVKSAPDLFEAAKDFRPYSILPEDAERAIDVANAIVRDAHGMQDGRSRRPGSYEVLSEEWLADTFAACGNQLASWLSAWREAEGREANPCAADIRESLVDVLGASDRLRSGEAS